MTFSGTHPNLGAFEIPTLHQIVLEMLNVVNIPGKYQPAETGLIIHSSVGRENKSTA